MKRLPKVLSIVWMQGYNKIPKHIFYENVDNWKLLNKKWTVNLVDDFGLRNACEKFSPKCLEIYDSLELMHLKIDFGRYVMLYLNGGGYVDMDCYALRSLDESPIMTDILNSKTHTIGLSTVNVNSFESYLFVGSKQTINNAVMFSTKKNPVLKKLIKSIMKNHQCMKGYWDFARIQYLTGPYFINKFFQKQDNCSIKTFPHYIFEPNQPFGMCDIRDETLAIHKFEMSWLSSEIKSLYKSYFVIKPYIVPFIIYLIIQNQFDFCPS